MQNILVEVMLNFTKWDVAEICHKAITIIKELNRLMPDTVVLVDHDLLMIPTKYLGLS